MQEPHSKKQHKKNQLLISQGREELLKAMHHLIKDVVADRILSKKIKQERTLIGQFIVKIKSIFKTDQPKHEESRLIGRIHELNKNSNEVLKILNDVREDLKKEVDEDLYSFVEAVMNPMIRDIARVQKIVKKEGAIHTQIEAFHKYHEWIDKAKLWVQVCSSAKNKQAISQAVIQHTLSDFVNLVDKDLKLIEDYQEHLLDDLTLSSVEKKQLKETIQKAIKFHLQSLLKLKLEPEHVNLDNLGSWKEEVDKQRNHHFDTILQIIDTKVSLLNPLKTPKEEHDALVGIFEQVSYLEMEIPMLVEKLKDISIDPFDSQITLQQLISLEQEVQDLYHNITIPTSLIERLQLLNDLLKQTLSRY